jgi:hypothetical protein
MAHKEKPSRDEDNQTRKQRLARIKKGPGVFVYDGSAVDTEWEPTVMRHGKKEPMFTPDGMPVVDVAGRQMYQKVGAIMKGKDGRPVFGGEPKRHTKPIDVLVLWGKEFPSGVPVFVEDTAMARKLRCLGSFDELEGDEAELAKSEGAAVEAPKKRGRKAKQEQAHV